MTLSQRLDPANVRETYEQLHVRRVFFYMEVRWRLFARDVLSLLADDDGEFRFGRPPRPVRGLRVLGVAVLKARSGAASATDPYPRPASASAAAITTGSAGDARNGKKRARGGADGGYCGGDGNAVEGECGLVGIGESRVGRKMRVSAS